MSSRREEQHEQETEQFGAHKYAEMNRREIRALIFRLLYAAQAHDYQDPLLLIVDNLNSGFSLDIPIDSETVVIAQAVIDEREKLDVFYEKLLNNWRPERVSVCARLILRLAIWELLHTETDPRIIINEAIELAKCFAESDAYRFINGLLDRVIKEGHIPGKIILESEEDEKKDS